MPRSGELEDLFLQENEAEAISPPAALAHGADHAGPSGSMEGEPAEDWKVELDKLQQTALLQHKMLEGHIKELRNIYAKEQEGMTDLIDCVKRGIEPASNTADPIMLKPPVEEEEEVEVFSQERVGLARSSLAMKSDEDPPPEKPGDKVAFTADVLWYWQDVTHTPFGKFISSTRFDTICAAVICVNAFVIGYASEYAINHLNDSTPTFVVVMEYLFFAFYSVELLLKLYVYRLHFFINREKYWNLFDLILVLTAVYDITNEELTRDEEGSNTNLTWMRLLRLLKMLKMLRMVRVMRFFRELRLMLSSIAGSVRPLFWSMLMLGLIMYIFGLCFLQGATAYLVDLPDTGLTIQQQQNADDLHKYWGSVSQSMISLSWAITGGNDWKPLASPLEAAGETYYFLFLVYIAFLTFAVLNVLTGIFVDAAMSVAEKDRDTVVHHELVLAQSYIEGMRNVLQSLDETGSGSVAWDDFVKHIEDQGVRSFLGVLDLDHHDMNLLFRMVGDERGTVCNIEDLLTGCTRIKGRAKNIDIFVLMYRTSKYIGTVGVFKAYVEESFREVYAHLEQRASAKDAAENPIELTGASI